MKIILPPKDYFSLCKTQEDYHQMDLSDYGPKRWPKTFPVSWGEHCKLARINKRLEKKREKLQQ